MKKRITLLLTISMALILFLQPFIITISYATDSESTGNQGKISQVFADKALYEALKELLGSKATYNDDENIITISNEEAENITEIVLEGKEITNLTGLGIFKNITNLDLSANELDENSNLDVINSFTNLQRLDLSSNNIGDVKEIEAFLNKDNFELDLQSQMIKVVDFIDIIRLKEGETSIDILNGKTETLNLKQIFTAYKDANIKIESLKVDGTVIGSDKIENNIKVNKESGQLEFLPSRANKYEFTLSIKNNKQTDKTVANYKIYRIDKTSKIGIMFNDEELYKAVRDQVKEAKAENGSFKFPTWTYDDEDLIIIANKDEVDKVTEINANSRDIKDLTGLEKFVGLQSLDLQDNSIISLNTISELYKNKQERSNELKESYKYYVTQLNTYISTYDSYASEIDKIDDEIEKITYSQSTEDQTKTIAELNENKDKLTSSKEEVSLNIEYIIEKIDSILNKTESGVSNIINVPSTQKAINEKIEKLDSIYNIRNTFEQKNNKEKTEIILNQIKELTTLQNGEGTKLGEFANEISETLNNYTDNEIQYRETKQGKEEAKGLIETKLNGSSVLSSTDLARIKARTVLDLYFEYLDKIDAEGKDETKAELEDTYKKCKSESEFKIIISEVQQALKIEDDDLLKEARTSIIDEFKTKLSEKIQEINNEFLKNVQSTLETYANGNQINYSDIYTNLNNQIIKLKKIYSDLLKIVTEDDERVEAILLNIPLTENKLTEVEQEELALISKRLINVQQKDIDEVIKIPDLETLNLSRNIISDTTTLEEIPTIKNLDLSYNLISKFDYSKFENLEVLDLSSNCIKNPTITKMENIKHLDLSNNRISSIIGINLGGLPKLGSTIDSDNKISGYLNLDGNEIEDIESLLKSTNKTLTDKGYSTLSKAVVDGESIVSLKYQIIAKEFEIINADDKESVDLDLPKIFRQSKQLQNAEKTKVVFEKTYPCTNVYSDGTKANLDTTIKDVKRQGTATIYMTTSQGASLFTDGTTYIITYKVVSDTVAPVINEILASTTDWTNEPVTISINATDDKSSKLQYSFDDGKTWQDQNTKTYEENTSNILIQVKDEAGNIAKYPGEISITSIDKTAPVIENVTGEKEKTTGETTITIEARDEESGVSAYSFDGGETWQESSISEQLENIEGIVVQVKDEAGNIATYNEKINVEEVDRTEPNILNVDKKVENNTVILTVEATDEGSEIAGYSFDGGATWQQENSKTYSENTTGIQIQVKDSADNVATYPEIIDITEIQKQTEDGDKEIQITSSKYSIDSENEYIGSIDAKTTVADLKSNITTNANNVIIKNAKGEEIEENGIIGTGATIEFTLEGEKKSLTAVVNGDLNGDGIIDDIDLLKLARYTVNIDKNLDGAYLKAADISEDGEIDDIDLLKLARTMVGLK